jgi:hypothetical protein
VTLLGEAKREAPVRTEPHPTRSFGLPAPGLPASTRLPVVSQKIVFSPNHQRTTSN